MALARYRAAVLDGLTVVLDLYGDTYLAVPQAEDPTADRLLEVAGALGVDPGEVRIADPYAIPSRHRDLGPDGMSSPTVWDCLTLISVLPGAMWRLRWGRPRSWTQGEGGRAPAPTAEMLDSARRFRSMRPFVPWLSRCLPHSLVLQSFLRASGHDPTLVIGVRLFPFEAHSWLQAGDIVLTDDLEQTLAFAPIVAG